MQTYTFHNQIAGLPPEHTIILCDKCASLYPDEHIRADYKARSVMRAGHFVYLCLDHTTGYPLAKLIENPEQEMSQHV
jgi:hypothetical protein